LRPFAETDAAACAALFERAWNAGHPYAPRTFDGDAFRAATKRERIVVAELGMEGVVGFVALYEPERFIHHLYVDSSHQRCGIGTALLGSALAAAGGKASLKCQTRNEQALTFYRSRGWTVGEGGADAAGSWVRMHSPGASFFLPSNPGDNSAEDRLLRRTHTASPRG
jgi:GNAT superfamily N-acetyltransferase